MTFEVILIEIKYLSIHNISVHINFYQNRLINESVSVMYQDSSIGDSLVHDVLLCEKVYLCVALKGSYIIGFH